MTSARDNLQKALDAFQQSGKPWGDGRVVDLIEAGEAMLDAVDGLIASQPDPDAKQPTSWYDDAVGTPANDLTRRVERLEQKLESVIRGLNRNSDG